MLLGRRDEGEGSGAGYAQQQNSPKASGGFTAPEMPKGDTAADDDDDDLPF